MQSPSQPALDQPLTDAEYDHLEGILRRFSGERVMDIEEMDGFFAALVSGPATVPPSVYLNEIWGGEQAPFATQRDLENFLNLAMRHWNFIARTLASRDLIFLPRFVTEEGEDVPRGNRWSHGFLRGIDLCREAWNEIFEDDDRFAILLPVMTLAHENDPDPDLRPWKAPPDRELREQVLAGLSVATQRLHDYFLVHRTLEARRERTGPRQAAPKIGRNDPCYCGSGKKYKRCCGNVTIH
jgi:uncharacterized protein